jgi:predicted dehydrogenase
MMGLPCVVRAATPSNRVVIGAIGVGNKGSWDLREFLGRRDVQVRAVCDVDARARNAAKAFVDAHYGDTSCMATADFRDIITREDIDAVLVATPDHWHSIPVIEAARMGKHVFCQKPLSYSVAEGRAMVEAVRRHGVVFQHGTQRRGMRVYTFACGLARNGYLGKLKRIYAAAPAGQGRGDPTHEPVPEWLDYDRWLGPSPFVPYTRNRTHRFSWYFITDYSVGFISGNDVHMTDIAQWGHGNELTGPVEVSGVGDFPPDPVFDTAAHWKVDYTFADGVVLTLADGPVEVRFEGSEGWVRVLNDSLIEAEPESLLDVHFHQTPSVPITADFIECIRTRRKTVAPVEVAHRATTIGLIGDIAMRLRQTLKWDPQAERFVGNDAANRMLSRAMREPWSVS